MKLFIVIFCMNVLLRDNSPYFFKTVVCSVGINKIVSYTIDYFIFLVEITKSKMFYLILSVLQSTEILS